MIKNYCKLLIPYTFMFMIGSNVEADSVKNTKKNITCPPDKSGGQPQSSPNPPYIVTIQDKVLIQPDGIRHDLSNTNRITVDMFAYCNRTWGYRPEVVIQLSPRQYLGFSREIPNGIYTSITPGKTRKEVVGENIELGYPITVARVHASEDTYIYFDIPSEYVSMPFSSRSKVLDKVMYNPSTKKLEWTEFSDANQVPLILFATAHDFSYYPVKDKAGFCFKELPWNKGNKDLKEWLETIRAKGFKFWFKGNQLQFSYQQLEKLPIPYPELMSELAFADKQGGFFLEGEREGEIVWIKLWEDTSIFNSESPDTLLDTLYALYKTRFKFWFEKDRLCFSNKQLKNNQNSCNLPFLLSRPKDPNHFMGVLEMVAHTLRPLISPASLKKLFIVINYKGSLDGLDYKTAAQSISTAVKMYPRGIDIIFKDASTKDYFAESISSFFDKNQVNMEVQGGTGPIIFTATKK